MRSPALLAAALVLCAGAAVAGDKTKADRANAQMETLSSGTSGNTITVFLTCKPDETVVAVQAWQMLWSGPNPPMQPMCAKTSTLHPAEYK